MEYTLIFLAPALILAALLIGMLAVGAILCISRSCCGGIVCITKLLRKRRDGLSISDRDHVPGHTA